MNEHFENPDTTISTAGTITNDTYHVTNKMRMPRSHEFDCKIQKFVADQYQINETALTSLSCIKCGITSRVDPTTSYEEEHNLCANCNLDNLVNSTVNDALKTVLWNELYATEKQNTGKRTTEHGSGSVERNECFPNQSFSSHHDVYTPCAIVNHDETDLSSRVGHISDAIHCTDIMEQLSSHDCHKKRKIEEISMEKKKIDVPLHIGLELTGSYNKSQTIGCGKFGKVYKVMHIESGSLAAAKEIPYRSMEAKERINDEVDILKLFLGCEYIVQLHEVIDSCLTKPKKMILITEYLDGGELFDQIAKEDLLTETQVVSIMTQILEGVYFIHQKGIIHRDLKPENIIYRSKISEKIKIIDFGFAVRYDKKNPPKTMVGTTIFVAPEVLRYENQSYKTDIWSVGVIAYNLLAGITPFEIPRSEDLDRQLTDIEIIENIERCQYDFDDDGFVGVSDDAKSFISQILIRDPEKRMASTDCLQHSWLKRSGKQGAEVFNRSISVQRMKNYVALKRWEKIGLAMKSVQCFKTSIMKV